MGVLAEYTCKNCGYVATVGGGVQRGFVARVVTIHCADCKEIGDVNAGTVNDPMPETFACPKDPGHNTRIWYSPGPCPKCGTTIESGQIKLMWD